MTIDNPEASPTIIKINGRWVNVEAWKKIHPGGPMALVLNFGSECLTDAKERFHGHDATDAFTSLHSEEAWAKLEKMKEVKPPKGAQEEIPDQLTLAFREWRAQLVKDGWFKRNWLWDIFYVSSITILCVVGTYIAFDYPWLAILLIGVGMQQAGWVGHDYVHGRGKVSYVLGRLVGGLFNAFSSEWWSNKHNTHHVHTNQVGVDLDIANDPILHLYIPPPDKEFPLRPYQHLYYHIVYAFLYVSWRAQSFQYAWSRRFKLELALMAINYLWLLYLPLKVSIGSVLLGGWLVAEVVTATHQSEDMIDGLSYNFVSDQFKTTRDVLMTNPIGNWLWGGMQYQLIHHLFPTMPRYRYATLQPQVFEFAKKNGIEYRTATPLQIFRMNYETMRKYAQPLKKSK